MIIKLNKKISEQNKLKRDYGALIVREALGEPAVVKGSSADRAGLKEFDIMLECQGEKITIENPKGKFAYLCGLLEQDLKNIKFENITGSSKQGIYGQNIEGIDLVNVRLKVQKGKVFNWTNVKNITQSLDQSSQINSVLFKN